MPDLRSAKTQAAAPLCERLGIALPIFGFSHSIEAAKANGKTTFAMVGAAHHALDARSEDTVITRAHSGKPCRVLKSRWSDEWDAEGAPKPLAMPYQHVLTGELLAAIEEHQVEPLVYEAAGQSVAWFNELTSVRAIVERLSADTRAALEEMQRNLRSTMNA